VLADVVTTLVGGAIVADVTSLLDVDIVVVRVLTLTTTRCTPAVGAPVVVVDTTALPVAAESIVDNDVNVDCVSALD
jgi:hypothetical protein